MRRFVCYCLRVLAAEQDREDRQGRISHATPHDQWSNPSNSDSEDNHSSGSDDSNPNPNGGLDEGDVRSTSRHGNPNADPMKDARELFPWQEQQKILVGGLLELLCEDRSEDDTDHGQQCMQQLLEVYRSFIFHKTHGQPYRSGLIHFLAVLGIDRDNNRLRRAADYAYTLAGMVYCMRLLGVEILLPSAQREEQEADNGSRERFLQQRVAFLADGSHTPTSQMISWLAYGKHVALNTGTAGSVLWSRDKQTLHFRGRPVEMAPLRRMVVSSIQQAEDQLWRELMWVSSVDRRFSVPLHRLVDDVTFTRRGISFVSRSGNGLSHGLDRMLTHMLGRSGRDRFRVQERWRRPRIRQYLRRADEFLELLLFCVHTTAGQPARGTEITSIRFRNGCFQDRNVFIMDGQVVIVTRYHKSQSQFDRPRVVPRFLPWRVGQLMVIYLAYIQPFREHLLVEVQRKGWSDHVWHDDAHGPCWFLGRP